MVLCGHRRHEPLRHARRQLVEEARLLVRFEAGKHLGNLGVAELGDEIGLGCGIEIVENLDRLGLVEKAEQDGCVAGRDLVEGIDDFPSGHRRANLRKLGQLAVLDQKVQVVGVYPGGVTHGLVPCARVRPQLLAAVSSNSPDVRPWTPIQGPRRRRTGPLRRTEIDSSDPTSRAHLLRSCPTRTVFYRPPP